jgi:hypothetical protein
VVLAIFFFVITIRHYLPFLIFILL